MVVGENPLAIAEFSKMEKNQIIAAKKPLETALVKWTLKEAYGKALGLGLSKGIENVEIDELDNTNQILDPSNIRQKMVSKFRINSRLIGPGVLSTAFLPFQSLSKNSQIRSLYG